MITFCLVTVETQTKIRNDIKIKRNYICVLVLFSICLHGSSKDGAKRR